MPNPPSTPAPLPPERRWSANTKLLASLLFVALLALAAWRFKYLLQPFVIAVVLAYLLHPLVTWLARHTFLNRALASILVYLALLAAGFVGTVWLGLTAFQQVNGLMQSLPDNMTAYLQEFLESVLLQGSALMASWAEQPGLSVLSDLWNRFVLPSTAGGVMQWNLTAIADQALAFVDPVIKQGGTFATNVVTGTFNLLATSVLIIMISLYLILDLPKMGEYVGNMAPIDSIREDMRGLWDRFTRIWASYLRGQILISILMSIIVSLLLSVLRVKNAIGLGLLAGALEFLPVIGPVISSVLAILAALFQGTTAFGLNTLQYVILVAVVVIVLQQLEGNILVPRIIGQQLRLHPLVVFMSVLMGTSLAGILGAVLAAPVAASLKLLGTYTWHRILDLSFAPADGAPVPTAPVSVEEDEGEEAAEDEVAAPAPDPEEPTPSP